MEPFIVSYTTDREPKYFDVDEPDDIEAMLDKAAAALTSSRPDEVECINLIDLSGWGS